MSLEALTTEALAAIAAAQDLAALDQVRVRFTLFVKLSMLL